MFRPKFDAVSSEKVLNKQIERLQALVEGFDPTKNLNPLIEKLQTMFAGMAKPDLDKTDIQTLRGKLASGDFNGLMHKIVAAYPTDTSRKLATDMTSKISVMKGEFVKYLHYVENNSKAAAMQEFVDNHWNEHVVLTASPKK